MTRFLVMGVLKHPEYLPGYATEQGDRQTDRYLGLTGYLCLLRLAPMSAGPYSTTILYIPPAWDFSATHILVHILCISHLSCLVSWRLVCFLQGRVSPFGKKLECNSPVFSLNSIMEGCVPRLLLLGIYPLR